MNSRTPQSFRTPEKWNSTPIPPRVAERAYTRVERQPDGCWISQYSTASHGYAQIGWQDKGDRWVVLAHRASWVYMNGQMPLGVTLDHLRKQRRCVNPEHLRVLPNYENARRVHGMDWPMGECANGHPNSSLIEHTARDKRKRRRVGMICAACRNIYQERYRWKKKNPGAPLPEALRLRSDASSQAAA